MRFNSVAEVKEWAERAAASDFKMYVEFLSGLNPYCTPDARNSWQRGYTGAMAMPWEPDLRWDWQYQRGAAAYRIIERLLDVT